MEKVFFIDKLKFGIKIMLIALMIGAILANLFFANVKIDWLRKTSFWGTLAIVARKRTPYFIIAIASTYTRLREIALEVVFIVWGFALGFTESIIAMNCGVTRYLKIVFFVLINIVLYQLSLCGIFSIGKREKDTRSLSAICICLTVFIIGIFVECSTYFYLI